MARAAAATTSRQRASRTVSTTASGAKRPKKQSQKEPVADWSALDQQNAEAQGWGVFECIDESSLKIFFEVQGVGDRFAHDGLARQFVMNQNKAGDELAIKALRAVFRSKAGFNARSK